jgi:hypothetical protein
MSSREKILAKIKKQTPLQVKNLQKELEKASAKLKHSLQVFGKEQKFWQAKVAQKTKEFQTRFAKTKDSAYEKALHILANHWAKREMEKKKVMAAVIANFEKQFAISAKNEMEKNMKKAAPAKKATKKVVKKVTKVTKVKKTTAKKAPAKTPAKKKTTTKKK